MRTVTIIAALSVVAVATPAFADQLFDTCYKLATDGVGHISQTAHGHFQKFVRECVRGKIPGVTAASVRGGHTDDSDHGAGEDGRIKCVAGSNGQRYCY